MRLKYPTHWPSFKVDAEWTLFLDRDGVINERIIGGYVTEWSAFKFLKDVLTSLPMLAKVFGRIIVVTNQAGIEKGLYSHERLSEIHDKMVECIEYFDGRIDGIYYCPFKDTGDVFCRKPNPGMALQAKEDFPDIDFKKSVMIGDSLSDIAFGNNLGMRTILIGDDYSQTKAMTNSIPDAKLDTLYDAALYFCG